MVPALSLYAEEESKSKSSTQKVGGLLFDVDEGVKVEQGPGGSVYVKSNKEYMQQKLEEIEMRLQSLDERVTELETLLVKKKEVKKSEASQAPNVLIT